MQSVDKQQVMTVPRLPAGPRSALFITTASYRDPQLRGMRSPVRGADDLAAALSGPRLGRFDVTTLADGTDSEIRLAIRGFLAGRRADETVLLYLAGHAIRNRSRLYFAAANTVLRYPQPSAVQGDTVLDELDRCRAGHRVLVLDCCFTGGLAAEPDDIDLAADLSLAGRDVAVLTGSSLREYSAEGRPLGPVLGGTAFTAGLAEGLATQAADTDGDGRITLADAYGYACRYVVRHAPAQAPWHYLGAGHAQILLTGPASVAPDSLAADSVAAHSLAAESEVSAAGMPASKADGGWSWGRGQAAPGRHSGVVRLPPAAPGPGTVRDQDPGRTAAAGPLILEQDKDDAYCVAFSPDGRLLASGGWGRPVRVRDIAPGGQASELRGAGTSAYDVAFSPDGRLLAAAGRDGTVVLCEVATGRKARARKPSAAAVRALAFSPNGALLASAHEDGAVRLWGMPALSHSRELKTSGETVYAVAFSPDGALLAAGCGDGAVRAWQVASGELVATLKCHAGWATGVAFSWDGSRLASAGADGTVLLHDVLSGQQAAELRAGDGIIYAIALSPDGMLLAAAYETGTVTCWHLGSGEQDQLHGHAGFVNDVVFSPVEPLLASAGKDGTVRLWR